MSFVTGFSHVSMFKFILSHILNRNDLFVEKSKKIFSCTSHEFHCIIFFFLFFCRRFISRNNGMDPFRIKYYEWLRDVKLSNYKNRFCQSKGHLKANTMCMCVFFFLAICGSKPIKHNYVSYTRNNLLNIVMTILRSYGLLVGSFPPTSLLFLFSYFSQVFNFNVQRFFIII